MLKQLVKFITWPAVAGVLAAIVIMQWQALQRPAPAASYQLGAISFADAVQRAAPSVVNIYTSKRIRERRHPLADDPFFRRFMRNNNRRERLQRSLGSGVIIAQDGLIMTNAHVIAGADEILVSLQDGREALAQVVGTDTDTDLALLQIELPDLQAIPQGQADQLRVGDVVMAIGNPYGFGHSVSQGIISALGRYGLNLSTYEDYIQTDAAVNQGNSGGALINTRGQLIGINTAIFFRSGDSVGIGLAIPNDLAMQVSRDLQAYGRVIRGWVGLEVQPLYGANNRQSLQVIATAPGSPAAKAGIQNGDIITHINMQAVVDGRSTMQQIALLRPGNAIDVTLLRSGEEMNLQAVVGQRPEQ